jgi:tripartite-type tricarboxylate transporter receptor subunit TctC
MKLPRRKFLHLAAGAVALPALSGIARAQTYPMKPVRIIVGFAAGGGTDFAARLIGQQLSERLGQPFLVENRPGADSNIAAEAVAKANPGKLNMGSGGVGGAQHVAGELFKMMAGVDLVHVPYRGGAPAIADLLGGHLQVMFNVLLESIPYIRAGKLHTLAVTTSSRFEALPDIPTVSEFLPGYEADAWWGVGAPTNTPTSVIDRLNNEINAALADPKIKARLEDLGATVLPGTPADFGKLIAEDTEKWGKVVRAANIKPQ